MPRGWAAPGTADLVRVYLLKRGRGTQYGAYKFIVAWLEARGAATGKRYVPPTYQSIRHMFIYLRRLGLVEDAGTAPAAKSSGMMRHYYRVAKGREADPRWRNPILAYYDPDRFREVARSARAVLTGEQIKEISRFLDEHPEL